MKAGFIGYRGFAQKLTSLFKEVVPDLDIIYYHPDKILSDLKSTNSLKKLFNSDFIVIVSPDITHFDYIKKLESYKGYIFCEKIPATEINHLKYYVNLRNNKIYFNFNYRKSLLSDLLSEYEDTLLYMNFLYGMGLALKNDYDTNWRSNVDTTPLGVLQTSGIHVLDLLIYKFGDPLKYFYQYSNISPRGNSFDNFSLNCVFNTKLKCKIDMYWSYTSPYKFSIEMITIDKLISIKRNQVYIRGPREYYKNNRFTTPPIIEEKNINIYEESLNKSVEFFIDTINKGGVFPESSELKNYRSNYFFLNLQNEIIGKH